MPTYATVAAPKRTQQLIGSSRNREYSPSGRRPASQAPARSSVESLVSRSSHIAPFSPDLRSERMSHSVSSEAGPDLLAQHFESMELKATQEAQYQQLHASATLRPREPANDLSGSFSSIFAYGSQSMHLEGNPEIRESRRMSGQSRSGLVGQSATHLMSVHHPSAFMPGSSPPSMADMPGYHASEPPALAAEPMSRGPSANSRQSWTTDPVLYPPPVVPHIQPNAGATAAPATAMSVGMAQVVQEHPTVSGMGGWISELPPQPASSGTLHPETAYASPPPPPPPPPALPHETAPAQAAPGMYFGGQPVDLSGARHRLFGHPAPAPAPAPFPFASPANIAAYQLYHPNLSSPMISHPVEMALPRGVPAGRGRSGSAPGYEGFGQ